MILFSLYCAFLVPLYCKSSLPDMPDHSKFEGYYWRVPAWLVRWNTLLYWFSCCVSNSQRDHKPDRSLQVNGFEGFLFSGNFWGYCGWLTPNLLWVRVPKGQPTRDIWTNILRNRWGNPTPKHLFSANCYSGAPTTISAPRIRSSGANSWICTRSGTMKHTMT